MSEVKVNKITPTTDCGTVTLGDSGDTVAIASGVTLTSAGSITNSGTITNTGTISGGTITGTIDGQVNWQTTVKTTGFTATAGEGYFCDTTSAAFTVTLPASPSAGDIVGIKDYANTADTNNITIGRNGSNIQGVANDYVIDTEGLAIVLLYVDSTKGWLSIGQSKASDISSPIFTAATGGTITTCGDFKIHTFTGPGTFTVTSVGNSPTVPSGGPNTVDYLVLAGGGSGGSAGDSSGGGGAGGYREAKTGNNGCHTASPLATPTGITVTATAFPITVGAGGGPGSGSNSVFSTITSAGGGIGGPNPAGDPGGNGGSGGGGGSSGCTGLPGGTGNTPPVSPPQGNSGGSGRGNNSPLNGIRYGGGGGGAGATGGSSGPNTQGSGGVGVPSSISGSATSYAGGAGAGEHANPQDATSFPNGSPCGTGGTGSNAADSGNRCATANRGGGGGGGSSAKPGIGYGGSGIVIVRYKFQ
jgi:hypothetical protein